MWTAVLPPTFAGRIEERPDETVIHVTLFNRPDPSRTDTATRADVAVVNAFLERFPGLFATNYRARYEANPERYGKHNWDNVRVELRAFSGIEVKGVESTLLAIAGGVAPDVLYVNFRQSDTYIRQGFLYPLDGSGAPPAGGRPASYWGALSPEERARRIHPAIMPVIRRAGPDGRTNIWALPYGGALGKVALYRKDLFDEAGLPYPTNNWTWSDLLHACKTIADPGRGRYGTLLGRGKQEAWYWTSFLWSAGGEVLERAESNDAWRAVFDSEAGAEALDFYTRLCTERWVDPEGKPRRGYVLKDPELSFRYWAEGRIGILFAYVDEHAFSVINPDVTGMVPVPIGPGGHRGAELNSRMMGLFSGIEEPAVRDAAWEYMKFFGSDEAQRIRTRVMVEGGLGAFVNPRDLKAYGYPDLVRLSPRGWAETFEIALATGHPEPYGRDCSYVYDVMSRPLQQAEALALEDRLPEDRAARLEAMRALLRDAASKANREMLGLFTPRERRLRRLTALAVLPAIVLAFAWALRRVARAFRPPEHLAQPAGYRRRLGWIALLLAPALLTVLVWRYVPLLRSSVMAFQDYRLIGPSPWVGLDNLADVLWSESWWRAVWNAARYSVLIIALTFLPPALLAVALQEIPRGKVLFRTLFYLPAVMSGLVIVFLWKGFYEPTEVGVLNRLVMPIPSAVYLAAAGLLTLAALNLARRWWRHGRRTTAAASVALGLWAAFTLVRIVWAPLTDPRFPWWQRLLSGLPEPVRWLHDTRLAMTSCVLPLLWAGMGPGSLIYLAALKNIPDELYESAEMDGAGLTDKVLFIAAPMLKPLLLINFLGVFIASWNAEAGILAMTGGAANTEVAGLHIFYKAFIFLSFGPAAAMAWMLGFMLIGFTMLQLQRLSRVEFKAAGGAP